MATVAETARISVTPSRKKEEEKVLPPPTWVRYANHLIERTNGVSTIPQSKAQEAVASIRKGLEENGKAVPTDHYILNMLISHGYFQVSDREDFLLQAIPPANPSRLRKAREDMGISIQEMAGHLKKAGVTPGGSRALTLYEQGVLPLSGKALEKLSKFYGKSPEWLTEMSDEEREEVKKNLARKINPERLKQARKDEGLTQRDLADSLGVQRTTIDHYESGRSFPKGHHLFLISRVLKKDLDWLCEGTWEPKEKTKYVIKDETKEPTKQENWKEHLMALLEVSDYFEALEVKAAQVDDLTEKLKKSEATRKAQWEVIEKQQNQINEILQALK